MPIAKGANGKIGEKHDASDQGQGAIRERLTDLVAEAALTLDDEAMNRAGPG